MKILIVMCGFFPGKKYGGPPVSIDNFCSLLKGYADCYIVTVNHDMGDHEVYNDIHEGWNNRGNAKVLYLSDAYYNAVSFERIIVDIQPDYIYLQGLFQKCVYPCLRLAKKHHIKVFLAPRGEICPAAFTKKYKKIPYIWALRSMHLLDDVKFQSTSDEESVAIKKHLGVNNKRIYLLTNIPSLPHELSEKKAKQSGIARLVFISRILSKKNLLSAINCLKGIKGNIYFDIYGPKEDTKYWLECENAIGNLPSNVKVQYMGVLSHDDIHTAFNNYDAFLFPTYSENYGHVIAEALVSGCIPIISNRTPWNDLNTSKAGWALPLSNESAFTEAVQNVVDMDNDSIKMIRSNISQYVDNKLKLDEIKQEYLKAFQ